MTDYKKVCWNCGNTDLEDMGNYVKCRKCGATHNDIKVGVYALPEQESIEPPVKPFARTLKKQRPSKTAVRRAAKARLT